MKALFFVLLLLLSGCAPSIRQGPALSERIALPPSAPIPGLKRGAALPQNWWEGFQDPELDDLVKIALANNPSLSEAKERLNRAKAIVTETGAFRYPHLGSIGRISRQRLSLNGNHTIYNGKTATIFDLFPVSIDYDLDLWGREEEISAASRASEMAALAGYRQGALMLSAAVIRAYFSLVAANRSIEIMQGIVTLSGQEAAVYRAAQDAGVSSATPSVSAEARVQEEMEKLSLLKKKAESLRYALLELIGKQPGDALSIFARLPLPEHFEIPEKIGLEVVSQRPDVQSALWNVKAGRHLEKSARDAFYPNVNLFALTGLNSIGLETLLGPGASTYAFGPAISLPIFEGGALRGRLAQRESEYAMAVQEYNRTLLHAARQIAEALSGLKHSRKRLEEGSAALGLKDRKENIARSGYDSGITGKLPYLEAKIEMDRERLNHMEESLDWLNSITNVATALGGGFGKWPS